MDLLNSIMNGNINLNGNANNNRRERTDKVDWTPLNELLDNLKINPTELKTIKLKASRVQVKNSDGSPSYGLTHPTLAKTKVKCASGKMVNIDYIAISRQDCVKGVSQDIREHPENWRYFQDEYGYLTMSKNGREEIEL